jgi:hypothetical protein
VSINSITEITGDGTGYKEILLRLDGPIPSNHILDGDTITFTGVDDDAPDPPGVTPPWADLPTGFNPLQNVSHRISDLGLGWDDDGFLSPVWASDGTVRNAERGGIGIIREFDGSGWLQDRDIFLEASVHPDLVPLSVTPQIRLDADVPDAYISNDLWLPNFTTDVTAADGFSGLVPIPNPDTSAVIGSPHPSGSPNLWQFTFPEDNPNITSGADIGFFFTLTGANPLYVARLESPDAGNWYRTAVPWRFSIQNVIRQRTGVSILNNVINPLEGEKAVLHYVLSEAGMVTINVFTLDGSLVNVLHRGRQDAGEYSTTWDGRNVGGRPVSRGIYFIRVVGPGIDEYRKVMVVK